MNQSSHRNRRWVLASRPHGAPVTDNFRLEEDDIAAPGEGQVLLRTVYLSLDPYMRGRMSDAPSYSPPVKIGEVMCGATVSRVVSSLHPDFAEGDWVLAYSGWQDYDIASGDDVINLGKDPQHPSWSLGILGMPGFTAYMGLLDIGQPKAGKRWSLPLQPARSAQRSGRSVKSRGVALSGSPGAKRSAVMPWRYSVLISVSTITRKILPNNWRRPARKGSISILKMSAAKSLMPCCHY